MALVGETYSYPDCWGYSGTGYMTQCYGDTDGTGDINETELVALKDSWYKVYPDPDYDPCADFDRDGDVKCADFLILKSSWYQSVPNDCTAGDWSEIYKP